MGKGDANKMSIKSITFNNCNKSINSINYNNLYKAIFLEYIMKQRISLSLDKEVIDKMDKSRKKGDFEIKRSTVVNSILKKHFKTKGKRGNKK